MNPLSNFINVVFTQPIFNVLMLFLQLFGDFGLSIIVMTVLIRLILFPLTLKQLKSQKATQALQPQMAEIRKKYKDQKVQAQAMQALYKEYGFNPLAGCLPLLVQLPVLYGLIYAFYAILNDFKLTGTAALMNLNGFLYPFVPHFHQFPNLELNWFAFIPGWHFSLAQPDPTHILPILAGLGTFIQLRMSMARSAATSKKAPAATDPMGQSMKYMQYLMPGITIFIGWTFPAGMALYWTVGTLFMMVQQYFVSGWGSLLVTPKFLTSIIKKEGTDDGSSQSYTGDRKRETQLLGEVSEPKVELATSNGAVGSKLRTNSRGNSSSSVRRPHGSSASARRRGGGGGSTTRRKASRG